VRPAQVPNISVVDAQKNLKKSLEKGIMKILSKMGISLLQCYHGAQVSGEHASGALPQGSLRTRARSCAAVGAT